MLNKYTDILDSNLQYNSAEQEQFKYSNIFRLENISCFHSPVFLSNWMYYDVGDSEFKVTTHTYQKPEEEIRKKKQEMNMMSLNSACFQNKTHDYHDVAPIKQKPVSHTDPK